MDVDTGQMDDSRYIPKNLTHETRNVAKELSWRGLNPLTEAERAELFAKRACFRCRKPGHMSRDCYSRRGPEMVNAGNTAPAPELPCRETGPQVNKAEAFKQLGGFRGVFDLLKETGTKQEKEKFADMMADF